MTDAEVWMMTHGDVYDLLDSLEEKIQSRMVSVAGDKTIGNQFPDIVSIVQARVRNAARWGSNNDDT